MQNVSFSYIFVWVVSITSDIKKIKSKETLGTEQNRTEIVLV